MSKKNIVYLAAHKAVLDNDSNVIYNDLLIPRDLHCDMLEVDLNNFDLVFASPPCNYYSIANYRRETSVYSNQTKHLLPTILHKLQDYKGFYFVENVRNEPLFIKEDVIPINVIVITLGRHTYFTNILNAYTFIGGIPQVVENIANLHGSAREGGVNVSNVFNAIKKAFEENLLIKY